MLFLHLTLVSRSPWRRIQSRIVSLRCPLVPSRSYKKHPHFCPAYLPRAELSPISSGYIESDDFQLDQIRVDEITPGLPAGMRTCAPLSNRLVASSLVEKQSRFAANSSCKSTPNRKANCLHVHALRRASVQTARSLPFVCKLCKTERRTHKGVYEGVAYKGLRGNYAKKEEGRRGR